MFRTALLALSALLVCAVPRTVPAADLPMAPKSLSFTAKVYGTLAVSGDSVQFERTDLSDAVVVVGLPQVAEDLRTRPVVIEGILTRQNNRLELFAVSGPFPADRNTMADPQAKGQYNIAAVGEVYMYIEPTGATGAYLNTSTGVVRLGATSAYPDMSSFAGQRVKVLAVLGVEPDGETSLRPMGAEVTDE